jgi:7,8-dihydropterin-6-yl-methyl-4-(beta-D-ribofuranosyl)aminobenzene 5'-phosphate synthase
MTSKLGITIVADNKAQNGLDPEHGFSAWIEAFDSLILLDTGQGLSLAGNAHKLGISLDETRHLVLSHGHYDHGGGIAGVMKMADQAVIHLHPGSVIPRYSLNNSEKPRSIGLPRNVIRFLGGLPAERTHWVSGPQYILQGVGLTGRIPRKTSFEDTGGRFFTDIQGASKDLLPDDQALWIDTPRGLVVCVGCAHAGIINTLNYIQEITKKTRIRAVIGGFHLINASRSRLEETVRELEKFSPELIAPCHCTGDEASALIKETFKTAFIPCAAGTTISLC